MNNMKQKILSLLVLLLTAASGAWADETPIVTITATGSGPAYSVEGIVTLETGDAGYGAGYGWVSGPANNLTVTAADGVTITKVKFIGNQGGSWEDTESPFQVLLQGFYVKNASGTKIGSDDGVISIEVYGTIAPAGPEVTFNDAKTEATMESMPTSDVTIDYELVRDMSVQMTATMGDGTDGLRYRVKKSEQNPGKYEPADLNMLQVLALVAVNDGIEQKDLTLNQDYFCRIYKLDEQTQQPDGDGVELADFDFAPGLYALKAFAKGSNYDGETALSNTFTLFQGYELEIAAGEYATYYKDEALYVEDQDAKLYTITTVGNETATATELTVAAANTPLLVKNNAAEAKTILLIPTTNATPDDVTPYEGFKGTLQATQITASTANQNNYALNGKEFVWVMDDIDIAANRAWLEIPATTTNGRALTIVFGDVTGLTTANVAKAMNGDWYDLNGRKLQAAPTKKGVYILNGKKVVVK